MMNGVWVFLVDWFFSRSEIFLGIQHSLQSTLVKSVVYPPNPAQC